MALPEPGDLARVVRDHQAEIGKSNVLKQCHVKEYFQPNNIADHLLNRLATEKFGRMVVVESLEPFWCEPARFSTKARVLMKVGELFVVAQNHLQRIEPPADTKDIFSTAPTPQEKADRAKDKLIKFGYNYSQRRLHNAKTS